MFHKLSEVSHYYFLQIYDIKLKFSITEPDSTIIHSICRPWDELFFCCFLLLEVTEDLLLEASSSCTEEENL